MWVPGVSGSRYRDFQLYLKTLRLELERKGKTRLKQKLSGIKILVKDRVHVIVKKRKRKQAEMRTQGNAQRDFV